MTARKVSARARRFVEEYLVDHNGSAAIVRAGFTGTRPDVAASKLLARPEVAELLERRIEQKLRGAGVRQDRVLGELAAIATHDIRSLFREDGSLKRPSEWDDATAAAISAVEHEPGGVVKIRRADKVRALELLGKYLKLWTERHELTGKDGAPLPTTGPAVTKDEFREIARELLAEV